MELDSEILEKVWQRWLVDRNVPDTQGIGFRPYNSVSRRYGLPKQFEDWLFSQGAFVLQEHNKRYIKFTSSKHGLMFAMKWI